MKTKFYSVYDRRVGYGNPFAQPNDECALRTMKIWLNGDTDFSKAPEDYELFFIGTYDHETGVFDSCVRPLVRGDDNA